MAVTKVPSIDTASIYRHFLCPLEEVQSVFRTRVAICMVLFSDELELVGSNSIVNRIVFEMQFVLGIVAA